MKNFILLKKDLESKLNYVISEEKYNEILNLSFLELSEDINTKEDLSYKVYNHLFVLGKGPSAITKSSNKKVTQWWCMCDCQDHNIILVRQNNLKTNNTKSCGCQNKLKRKESIKKAQIASIIDLTNKRFGKLVALERTTEKKNNSYLWKCQCDCGNIHYVPAHYLNAGRCYSCGCLTESKGNLKIKNILIKEKIDFISEKTFNSCKFLDSKAFARFDFYLPIQNILIEFDGKQHYKELDANFFRDSLEKRKQHDLYKNQWCLENNIPLYRIPYYDIKNINSLKDILNNKYLIKKEN